MKYCITGSGYQSPLFALLAKEITILDYTQIQQQAFAEADQIYVPSEEALSVITAKMMHAHNQQAVRLFKDKAAFRQFSQPLFPDFYFRQIKLSELADLHLDFTIRKQYMIKPMRGFFGVGVRTIEPQTNLTELAQELEAEISAKSGYFPGDILSQTEFLIEEYIGEASSTLNQLENAEIAVDLYYTQASKPVIVGIYHHPMPAYTEYFHVLYYTSAALFALQEQILKFFIQLQDLGLNAQSFPLHAEFKYLHGQLIPIEINPYRFGGFGLADVPYHAFGLDPFKTFFEEQQPDWSAIWQQHQSHYYGWVLAYNGTRLNSAIQQPDSVKFKQLLQDQLLAYYPVDYQKNPVFALAYIQTTQLQDLEKILQLDFNDYILPKQI